MRFAFVSFIFSLFALPAFALEIGAIAPEIDTLRDLDGQTHRLSQLRGKVVVLEWLNHGCPFVQKHYNSKNMQTLQKRYKDLGVTWFSVVSSAPGKQGADTAAGHRKTAARLGSQPTAILLDPTGEVGKAYGAKTTPHFFIIDPAGKLAYQGAIDDRPSTDIEDVSPAKNYVSAAIEQLRAGKKVEVPNTKAYGCSVKY